MSELQSPPQLREKPTENHYDHARPPHSLKSLYQRKATVLPRGTHRFKIIKTFTSHLPLLRTQQTLLLEHE